MTDKDRTDEKLWKYVHITRDNRFGLVDTKIGGNLDVTNHISTFIHSDIIDIKRFLK